MFFLCPIRRSWYTARTKSWGKPSKSRLEGPMTTKKEGEEKLSNLGQLYQEMIDAGIIMPTQEPTIFRLPTALKEVPSVVTHGACEKPITSS